MVNNNSQEKRALALIVIGCCIASILFDGASISDTTQNLRRSLLSKVEMPESKLRFLADDDNEGIYPWAKQHLRPVDVVPEPDKETVLFWHIPKR